MKKFILPLTAAFFVVATCDAQRTRSGQTSKDIVVTSSNGTKKSLSNDQIVSALKEALTVGTNNSAALASKVDGYYKNPSLYIPFPAQAAKVKEYAKKVGMSSQVDKFVLTMNRAAEEAAKNAAPVFINAVTSMSLSDGYTILQGGDHAATEYLKAKTTAELTAQFTPIVQAAINKVQVTKYWTPIITKYNMIPTVQKQNPDLTAYVTGKAIDGLFKLIADEELKIRKDPAAQVSSLLQDVFGTFGH